MKKYFDYCHLEYEPIATTKNKKNSQDIFFSILTKDEKTFINNLIKQIGKEKIVWGIKTDHEKKTLEKELYFYNYNQKDPSLDLKRFLNTKNTEIKLTNKIPYFMYSLNLDNNLIEKNILNEINIYLKNNINRTGGTSYKIIKNKIELENKYTFYNINEKKLIMQDILNSIFFYPSKKNIHKLFPKYLEKFYTVCIAKKRKKDRIYYSRININQLMKFTKDFNFKKEIKDYLDNNKEKLDHLYYDISIDYITKYGDLKIMKIGFYGYL